MRKIQTAGGTRLRDNVGMLAHVSTSNRGERRDRRDLISLCARRALRLAIAILAGSRGIATAEPRLTFTKDVAPIVWSRCATCHRPGEIGPFSLITYDEVKRHATQIPVVTAPRAMPPWQPLSAHGEHQDTRRPSDRQLPSPPP